MRCALIVGAGKHKTQKVTKDDRQLLGFTVYMAQQSAKGMQMNATLRKFAWRLGRKLYCWGRGDVANSPDINGEYWLLTHYLNGLHDPVVLLDVGANKGEWSLRALVNASVAAKSIQLHAFEPSEATRHILERNLSAYPQVEICALALSSAEGQADFYSAGVGVGTNSLDPISGANTERVRVSTLDRFVEEQGFESVGMVKIDTEGFDLEVLKGADSSLSRGLIELVQFEYNWRWLLNKASLREVFALIAGKPYRLGKLVGESVEFYDEWHFELDRFFENNYVLVRAGSIIERLGCTMRINQSNVAVPVVES